MADIENIRLEVPGVKWIRFITQLPGYVWELNSEVHGEVRNLGEFTNFRYEEPKTLIFDFESRSMYGDQLVRDHANNNVAFSVRVERETDHPDRFEGFIHVFVTGWIMMAEPPTTVCDEPSCEKIFPAMDAYRSVQFPERMICPECFQKGEKLKRYKMKEGEDGGAEDSGPRFGNFPRRIQEGELEGDVAPVPTDVESGTGTS